MDNSTLEDGRGRSIGNLVTDEFLFTFWVDHASKIVRIIEIIKF